ncbi:Helix-loop-helix protein delilah [Portunus trituberculatus]|uniref:Helix-loop-helix protein delilah n=2 Tax=Portunus trituberculatus TaxID=210409 RepID=A0A5B7DS50_PORTR|nr:Helix-loop-helix protein delilah [Portunus trituberculatus]
MEKSVKDEEKSEGEAARESGSDTTGADEVDTNNNNDDKNQNVSPSNKSSGASNVKYQLRPRAIHPRRRCDSEWSLPDTLRHKPRPPPLSRYRRKTANARERCRMRQINTAFESLRGVLPSWVCSRRAAADMTKITTLRLASAYIRSLQDILDGNAPEDTCSWVLSSILGEAAPMPDPEPGRPCSPGRAQQILGLTPPQTDFVSFLCSGAESQVLQDNMDSLSSLSPMSETEAVAILMGTDPQPRPWLDGQQSPLVS